MLDISERLDRLWSNFQAIFQQSPHPQGNNALDDETFHSLFEIPSKEPKGQDGVNEDNRSIPEHTNGTVELISKSSMT